MSGSADRVEDDVEAAAPEPVAGPARLPGLRELQPVERTSVQRCVRPGSGYISQPVRVSPSAVTPLHVSLPGVAALTVSAPRSAGPGDDGVRCLPRRSGVRCRCRRSGCREPALPVTVSLPALPAEVVVSGAASKGVVPLAADDRVIEGRARDGVVPVEAPKIHLPGLAPVQYNGVVRAGSGAPQSYRVCTTPGPTTPGGRKHRGRVGPGRPGWVGSPLTGPGRGRRRSWMPPCARCQGRPADRDPHVRMLSPTGWHDRWSRWGPEVAPATGRPAPYSPTAIGCARRFPVPTLPRRGSVQPPRGWRKCVYSWWMPLSLEAAPQGIPGSLSTTIGSRRGGRLYPF